MYVCIYIYKYIYIYIYIYIIFEFVYLFHLVLTRSDGKLMSSNESRDDCVAPIF